MTFHHISILTSCAFALALAPACGPDVPIDGDETGEHGDGDEEGAEGENQAGYGGNCGEEMVSIIEDLDASLPGFDNSANEILGLIEGTFLGEFSWMPDDGLLTSEHAGTSSPLTMSVSYEGGEICLTEVELVGQPPQGGAELAGGECSNILEVEVTLDFATEDGLFAEAFQIPIRMHGGSDHALPSFYFSLDVAALQGQLALADFTVEQGSVTDFVLIGQLDGDAASGGLDVEITSMDWVAFGPIASFDASREI